MSKSCCIICGQQECPGHTYSVPGRAVTDNTAVIRALEKRVEELEEVAEWSVSFEDIATQAPDPNFSHWDDFVRIQTGLRKALKAAGYLGGGDE